MKPFFIPVFAFLFTAACQSVQPASTAVDAKQADTVKKNYLPVADYLKSEIAAVDSFPYKLMKYHIENNKTDSGIITTVIFDKIAGEFLKKDLDSDYFEKNFEENSFIDRSTNLISFTYSTKDTGFGLKRVDVLLSPGTGINKLNSIYMEAISGNPDSVVISKLTWNAGRNFRILHIQKPKKGAETASQTIVVWDSRE